MNFICFDTEDNSKELGQQVAAGVPGVSMFDKRVTQIAAIAADGRTYYNKGDVSAFLQWLQRQPEKYIYALNIQYDLGNLFGDVLDAMDCTLVGSRMIKAVWGDKIFVDVYNIWFQSVESLGKVFGLAKLNTDSMSTDKAYVFRDVEIIREAMLFVWQFAQRIGLEEVPPTLGSLGVNLWRYWGGETCHDSHELSREAIFGGRVELFKTRNESEIFGYCDINSLYPSVMRLAFPGEMEATGTTLKAYGIATATVKIPKMDICPLPFRDKAGRILYGYGEITGTWPIAEIRAAEHFGAKIVKVHEAIGTDQAIWPYKTYMERIYQIRLQSKNAAEKELYKRLMNCLYGRTGSSGKIGRTVKLTEKTKDRGVNYGKRVLTSYLMPLGEEVNWSHCAHVTAYGRITLLNHLMKVGAEQLIYCDTDSVIFDAPGRQFPFDVGSELGIMKIEQQCAACFSPWSKDCCAIPGRQPRDFWNDVDVFPHAPKMYQLGSIYKAKGVPKKLQRQFIETGHAAYDMPFKFREAVAFYDRGNKKKLSVWRKVEKFARTKYDKKSRRKNRFFPCEIRDNQQLI